MERSKPTSQIIQGDCLKLMPLLGDKSIDMILCDLPYETTVCKWDVIIPFEPFPAFNTPKTIYRLDRTGYGMDYCL